VDAIVASRLKERGLALSPAAPSAALCRRLYLDLIGLPPSPQELADFEKRGFEATVETLLQSERFGEKWARHWLDVARYSEDQAHTFAVKPKTQAYRYRDWVIAALNRDMPFDQFTIEQIAGDMLPNATVDQKIATGFNASKSMVVFNKGDCHESIICDTSICGCSTLHVGSAGTR
jgi:hypothetical protein